jgi:hypothetical protein
MLSPFPPSNISYLPLLLKKICPPCSSDVLNKTNSLNYFSDLKTKDFAHHRKKVCDCCSLPEAIHLLPALRFLLLAALYLPLNISLLVTPIVYFNVGQTNRQAD